MKDLSKAVKTSAREEMLLSAAQAGYEWAFVELCYRHSRRILFTLYRITRNREDAEDAFQATFLVLAKTLRTLRKRASFASWLHGVARRVALPLKLFLRAEGTQVAAASSSTCRWPWWFWRCWL